MFNSCNKQAMHIEILPLLFSAGTPPTHPEGAAQTETNPAAGTCMYVCACVQVCVCMWVRGWVGFGV